MYSSSDNSDDSGHQRNSGHRRSSSSDRRSSSGSSTPSSRKHRKSLKEKRKENAKAAAASAAAQQEILRQLASLQLPHMMNSSLFAGGGKSSRQQQQQQPQEYKQQDQQQKQQQKQQRHQSEPPTIRILVVADIDLASASALAESALTSEELHRVDLCIACGPFCREEDLKPYYQGRQRRRHMARYSSHHHHHVPAPVSYNNKRDRMGMVPPMPQHNYAQQHANLSAAAAASNQYPFKRTREETAALEGLMTAALSQLESIVCRVIFVPGKTDPMTTICTNTAAAAAPTPASSSTNPSPPPPPPPHSSSSHSNQFSYTKERRLTPNSRNIHQHWMPLGPGLGCAGLLYLDWQRLQQNPPPLEDGEMDDDEDGDEDDDDQDDDDEDSDSELPEDSSFSYNNGDDPYNNTHNNQGSSSLARGVAEDGTNHDLLTETERAEQYGSDFVNHLKRLVELAPPTSAVTDTPTAAQTHATITGLLHTKLFQSILVTHFHHLEKDLLETTTSGTGDLIGSASNGSSYGYGFGGYGGEDHHSHAYSPYGSGGGNMMNGSSNNYYGQSPNPSVAASNSCGHSHAQGGPTASMFGATQQQQTYHEQQFHDDHDDDEEEECFDPPWPIEHEAFCALPLIQEHVLLEIAAGRNSKGATVRPMELPKGEMRVVLPGSLRERGEFCLVDVSFMKGNSTANASAAAATASAGSGNGRPKEDYRWRVRRTRFHTIDDYV